MSRLDEIEARANAATPGPWRVSEDSDTVLSEATPREIMPDVVSKIEEDADVDDDSADEPIPVLASCVDAYEQRNESDIEFAAYARDDVPYLIARVRAFEAENERIIARVGNDAVREIDAMQAERIMDAAFARVTELEATVARVRAMHPIVESLDQEPACKPCEDLWPCATIRALDGPE